MIKYIFCILIGIFFVYGAGYTASIEETAELPAEVTATFVSQYAGDHSLFNDETAESKVCDAIRPHSSFSRELSFFQNFETQIADCYPAAQCLTFPSIGEGRYLSGLQS